jgi:formate dehydrogenase major subunit
MDAAAEGDMKARYIMGENPMVSDPNTTHVEEGLRNLDLLVHQDIFLTETGQLADYVLPAALFAEKSGSYTNTERRVQWGDQLIPPPAEARPDWKIICEMGRRTVSRTEFEFHSPEEILAEINEVVPQYRGITPDRVKQLGGLCWPCPNEDHPGTPILHVGECATDDGLGHITPAAYRLPAEEAGGQYPLTLTTGRLVLHHNTGAMTRRSKSLVTREPELFVEINPADAKDRELSDGDTVLVRTRRGETECKARIKPGIKEGITFMSFHFAGTNVLTNDELDPTARIPEYKVCACEVKKL